MSILKIKWRPCAQQKQYSESKTQNPAFTPTANLTGDATIDAALMVIGDKAPPIPAHILHNTKSEQSGLGASGYNSSQPEQKPFIAPGQHYNAQLEQKHTVVAPGPHIHPHVHTPFTSGYNSSQPEPKP